MKPDWNDAPEWANYLAKDPNNRYYWYEFEPWIECPARGWYCSGRVESCEETQTPWKDTLEKRPT